MKTKQVRARSGGALLWILIVGAILVGYYLVFHVMGLQRIRAKIDEDMGKRPPTAARGDEGVLMQHQERLRQQSEDMEKAAGEAAAARSKIDALNKQVRREMMQAEGVEVESPAAPGVFQDGVSP